jgi:hypothetical protein
MNVIDMLMIIRFVANEVFPKASFDAVRYLTASDKDSR